MTFTHTVTQRCLVTGGIYLSILCYFQGQDSSFYIIDTVSSVAMATSHCPVEHLLENSLPVLLHADDKSGISDSLQTLLNHLSPLLLQRQRSVQHCSFTLLKR